MGNYEDAVERAREILDQNHNRAVLGLPLHPVVGITVASMRICYEAMPAEQLARNAADKTMYKQICRDTALQLRQGVALSKAQMAFVADVLEGKPAPKQKKGPPILLIFVIGSTVDAVRDLVPNVYRNAQPSAKAKKLRKSACDAVAEAATGLGVFMTYNVVTDRYRQHRKTIRRRDS